MAINGRALPIAFGVTLLLAGLVAIDYQARSLRASGPSDKPLERDSVTFELLAHLPNALRETSGVATSRRHSGVLWTHNDSGDGADLFAIDMSGRILARYRLEDAGSRDWEDIALGPCPTSVSAAGECLYIGDTGNNDRDRRRLSVYVLPEPDPSGASPENPLQARVRSHRLRYEYPDSRRDAEAIAVTPSGDLLIVNRGRHRAINVYRIAAAALDAAVRQDGVVQAESTGRVPFTRDRSRGRVVTGATYSRSGERLIVRTYTGIWALRYSGTAWEEIGNCQFGWRERAGEAIDFLDDGAFVLTSEAAAGSPATVHRVVCDLGD